ncbi:circularly permuted type 2 ATP-grasp protein [Rhodoferax sp. PAMC 29310]|uniref:circularly permuted type 2 ATP-grasp protein n=1 Tax=Rhodoferax sp. PAMC 29310 TaxID=2822760 RepID=UPI001B3450BD|nr:circularly permuted type 2 ATP-grasp protein [Rhodoferax sp. PAMC 29310]
MNETREDQQPDRGRQIPPLLAGAARPGHFDELRGQLLSVAHESAQETSESLADASALSGDWRDFFEQIDAKNPLDLNHQLTSLQRQIRDNGVTYNVYSDDGGPQRPWSLDLFPLLIDPTCWQKIEAGVRQRMRLLESIMSDVYGPQTLLEQGMLPPALVQGHPGYLRAMQGVRPVGGTYLHIAAFDLAHGPDGNWWVIGQRTQAPSGLGYLLENRLAISSQFPQAFQNMRVQRLAATYRALMDSLKLLSPAGSNSHLVLLTPGPYNETYFEHAFLARYLGLTLVEGSDLVVRREHVYLKTLKGLVPVHGLLKRVDDEYLDPLEQRPDSTLGVPGLLQAIRAGNVLVANAPGSAFLESPALLGFLPALSEHLIQEELQLPSLPTWWCGEASAMQEALAQLSACVVKPTYPGSVAQGSFNAVLGRALSPAALDQWEKRIQDNPDWHTVQRYLPLSQMPTWPPSASAAAATQKPPQVSMRSVVLRVFAVSDGTQSWRVLPGGLARVASPSSEVASMQRGGSSADVWALTGGEVDQTTLLLPNFTPAALAQRKRMVTSRAAENLFWLGRYTERAENAIRLARLTLECLNGEERSSEPLLDWLSQMAVSNTLVLPDVPPAGLSRRVFERSLIAGLSSSTGATSVGYYLRALKQAGASVRERLSQEHWRILIRAEEQLFSRCAEPIVARDFSHVEALQILRDSSDHMAAITGAQTDRMTRDDGWRLLSIGRHIERLSFLANALFCGFDTGSIESDGGFDAMLSLFDSTITFHAQFQQNRDLPALIDLLVLDRDNPRSLNWVAHTLRGRLAKLAGSEPGQLSALSLRVPDPNRHGLAPLCETKPREQDESGSVNGQQDYYFALNELMLQCSAASNKVSDAISTTYFTHSAQAKTRKTAP